MNDTKGFLTPGHSNWTILEFSHSGYPGLVLRHLERERGGQKKGPNAHPIDGVARRVLASRRLGMPCYGETNEMVLMYGPWGFQKCIWEP